MTTCTISHQIQLLAVAVSFIVFVPSVEPASFSIHEWTVKDVERVGVVSPYIQGIIRFNPNMTPAQAVNNGINKMLTNNNGTLNDDTLDLYDAIRDLFRQDQLWDHVPESVLNPYDVYGPHPQLSSAMAFFMVSQTVVHDRSYDMALSIVKLIGCDWFHDYFNVVTQWIDHDDAAVPSPAVNDYSAELIRFLLSVSQTGFRDLVLHRQDDIAGLVHRILTRNAAHLSYMFNGVHRDLALRIIKIKGCGLFYNYFDMLSQRIEHGNGRSSFYDNQSVELLKFLLIVTDDHSFQDLLPDVKDGMAKLVHRDLSIHQAHIAYVVDGGHHHLAHRIVKLAECDWLNDHYDDITQSLGQQDAARSAVLDRRLVDLYHLLLDVSDDSGFDEISEESRQHIAMILYDGFSSYGQWNLCSYVIDSRHNLLFREIAILNFSCYGWLADYVTFINFRFEPDQYRSDDGDKLLQYIADHSDGDAIMDDIKEQIGSWCVFESMR